MGNWVSGSSSPATITSTGMTIKQLLGDSFVDHDKKVVTSTAINTDIVCLYFSAHWCPPCRGFTPTLSKFYTDAKAAGKSISVVFMTRDSDEKSFYDYFSSMSFNVALPYNDSKIQGLMSQWGIRGIPTLVVLDKNGNIVNPNGRSDVTSLGVGAVDKWLGVSAGATPPNQPVAAPVAGLGALLGTKLVNHKGETVDAKEAEADVTCIYFSAHWCPPCRGFTPALSDFYTKTKEAGKSISVVFASRDSDAPSFSDYFNSMSFPYAIPYGDERVSQLMAKWGIRGIPTLVVLDRQGNVIRANGRPDVQTSGAAAFDTWTGKPAATPATPAS